eukprot:Gregarina_sp_Poly_1__8593@NODE_50_length_17596_cov_118_903303_g43_i0_p1_GENE_NODE_50_length_17596_cov_118_903303_g43_i0NODE_50_length_17596_cov_118_903303_g43_i0_p1_ORF_typecomplete_len668_score90_13Sec1/PF00995_23/6_3e60_NODE_50_length_17596_cov_118_903303_g43_i077339736
MAVSVCFVPERRCLMVAKLLDGLRQITGVEILHDSEFRTKNLKVLFLDTHLRLINLDSSVLSLNIRDSFKRLHSQGDTNVINELATAIEHIMKLADHSESAIIYSAGPWAQIMAKMLQSRLYGDSAISDNRDDDADGEQSAGRETEFVNAYLASNKVLEADRTANSTKASPLQKMTADSIISGARLTRSLHLLLTAEYRRLESDPTRQKDILQLMQRETDFCLTGSEETKDEIIARIESPSYKIYFPSPVPCPLTACDNDNAEQAPKPKFEIKSIILIDRKFDLFSPFITPFTYESLLDLVWGIDNNHLVVPGGVVADTNAAELRLRLSDSERVYAALRDLPHVELGATLHSLAVEMQTLFQTERRLDWSVQQLQTFMNDLKKHCGDHRELTQHIQIVTHIIHRVVKHPVFYTLLRIEDDIISGSVPAEEVAKILGGLVQRDFPLVDVIRLCTLNSRMNKPDLSSLRLLMQAVCRAHGVSEAARFSQLESAGILRTSPAASPCLLDWDSLNRVLKCTDSPSESARGATSTKTAKDITYVHSGYAPVSVRFVQMLTEDPPKTLQSLEKLNSPEMKVTRSDLKPPRKPVVSKYPNDTTPISLVVFIGGVTRSELSALRHLSRMHSPNRAYLAVTTEVFSYLDFVNGFQTDPEHGRSTQTAYTELLKEAM